MFPGGRRHSRPHRVEGVRVEGERRGVWDDGGDGKRPLMKSGPVATLGPVVFPNIPVRRGASPGPSADLMRSSCEQLQDAKENLRKKKN